MTRVLRHRGPDDQDIWLDAVCGIALGNRRLAIIDVSAAGRQPMRSSCGRYVLSMNGEIYNFRSLRAQLQREGHCFHGSSDTEVFLAAVTHWGLEHAIENANGMFAFALWDIRERTLHLARDRFGEKPLYWGRFGSTLVFGSEIKALRQHPDFDGTIDRDALALYLRYCYVPAPLSIFNGVFKLLPAAVMSMKTADETPTVRTYWAAKEAAQRGLADTVTDPGEALASLKDLLSDSIKLRTESDRPLGAFLSGGIDSSAVVSLMHNNGRHQAIKTFCLGFEEADEAPFSRQIAARLDTEHTEKYVTAADALRVIPRIPALYDEPFSDSSQIPTFLISVLAREQVVVALTGDGGDELFGGYGRYRRGKPSGALPAGNSTVIQQNVSAYLAEMSHWSNPTEVVIGSNEPLCRSADPAEQIATDDFRAQMMFMDTITYLPDDLLVKVDRAAMAASLETRAPYLDHRVFEFAWRLPMDMKIKAQSHKWILRQLLAQFVPPQLFDRPKQGFEVPMQTWLRTALRDWAEDLLSESRLRRDGFFSSRPIREKWELLLRGERQWRHAVWSVLVFQAWLEDCRPSLPAVRQEGLSRDSSAKAS